VCWRVSFALTHHVFCFIYLLTFDTVSSTT
jgi:hypothetical protein